MKENIEEYLTASFTGVYDVIKVQNKYILVSHAFGSSHLVISELIAMSWEPKNMIPVIGNITHISLTYLWSDLCYDVAIKTHKTNKRPRFLYNIVHFNYCELRDDGATHFPTVQPFDGSGLDGVRLNSQPQLKARNPVINLREVCPDEVPILDLEGESIRICSKGCEVIKNDYKDMSHNPTKPTMAVKHIPQTLPILERNQIQTKGNINSYGIANGHVKETIIYPDGSSFTSAVCTKELNECLLQIADIKPSIIKYENIYHLYYGIIVGGRVVVALITSDNFNTWSEKGVVYIPDNLISDFYVETLKDTESVDSKVLSLHLQYGKFVGISKVSENGEKWYDID